MKNKKGNILAMASIIIIVAITAGVIGFLFAKKSQAPAQQAIVAQPSAKIQQQSPTPTVQQPTQPADEADYFLIPEAGIKFKTSMALRDDLVYTIEKDSSLPGQPRNLGIGLSTKTLIREGGAGCNSDGLGRLIKIYGNYLKDAQYTNPSNDAPWWMTTEGLKKDGAVQFDGFFVRFQGPQGVCADNVTKTFETILSSQGELLSKSIKNIELIK